MQGKPFASWSWYLINWAASLLYTVFFPLERGETTHVLDFELRIWCFSYIEFTPNGSSKQNSPIPKKCLLSFKLSYFAFFKISQTFCPRGNIHVCRKNGVSKNPREVSSTRKHSLRQNSFKIPQPMVLLSHLAHCPTLYLMVYMKLYQFVMQEYSIPLPPLYLFCFPPCWDIMLFGIFFLIKGADGIRGLKGTKGEKVSCLCVVGRNFTGDALLWHAHCPCTYSHLAALLTSKHLSGGVEGAIMPGHMACSGLLIFINFLLVKVW